jgi:hypothetical protein
MNRFIIIIALTFLLFSCESYRYIILYDKSELTEEMILNRAIKEEEHVLKIILTKSIVGSHVNIAGESLDFRNIYSYYDQKLEKCTDNSCFMINVNNRMDITLKIDKISIQLQDEISNDYQYLIVEKRGKRGIKLKYTNQL